MKFSIQDIFRKYDQMIYQKKSLVESFIFYDVLDGHKTMEGDKENHHTQKECQLQLWEMQR